MISADSLTPLNNFLKQKTPDKNNENKFYDQAWAWVYFFMNEHQEGFKNYLSYLKKHPFISLKKGDKSLLEKFLCI